MTLYRAARAGYRLADRWILRHVPDAVERWTRGRMLWVARHFFRGRIEARTVDEFIAGSRKRMRRGRLPAWAETQLHSLARLEPSLTSLVGPGADIGECFIPWKTVHVGRAFAALRRQLPKSYACMVLMDGRQATGLAAALHSLPRPLAVVDVGAAPTPLAFAASEDVDCVALPCDGLNHNERATVLVRLVLQVQPAELRFARHEFIEFCVQRHGLALSAVCRVQQFDSHGDA